MSSELGQLSRAIRREVIEQSWRAGVGHIGSCLSVVDVLAALYGDVLDVPSPDDPERDRFIMSKGHAALALYCTLHATGRLPTQLLTRYCAPDGTALGGHPEHALPEVELSTGSLGHGLSVACGAALAARLQGSLRRVFVLMSDAECDEGSVWEAAMFAAHRRLGSLVAIIDANGQQALGHTRDVLGLEPLPERWRAFGWDVHELDGHDPAALAGAMRTLDLEIGAPHVLVARTTFGKGVSYMEGQIDWHYLPMSEQHYSRALDELAAPV